MTPRVIIGFAVLCVLYGSAWILDAWRPGVFGGLRQIALHSASLALVFAAISLRMRQRLPPPRVWGLIVLLVGLPPVAISFASPHVDQLTIVLIYTLVPSLVALIRAQQAEVFVPSENPLRQLLPALAGLAGAALILPFHWPHSLPGQFCFGLLLIGAVLSAWAAVELHVKLRAASLLSTAAVFATLSCACAAAFCWLDQSPIHLSRADLAAEVARCLFLDAPILLLTVWLLREMPPAGFSTRYLLAPLITIIEGYVLLRPDAGWLTALGIVLLALGSWALLRPDSNEVPLSL